MSDFEAQRKEVFDSAWKGWPSKYKAGDNGGVAWHWFCGLVDSESWLEVFVKALEEEIVQTTFSQFIKKIAKKNDKVFGAVRASIISSENSFIDPVIHKPLPQIQEAFKEVRAAWPENKDFQEPYEVARKAFETACQNRDVEEIRRACLAYSEAWFAGEITYRNPYWLKNFVSKDGMIDEWLHKLKHKPNPEELKVFEVAWAWYPNFNGKEKDKIKEDCFEYWRRMVKKEDYFDFMVALRAYRMERKDKADEDEDEDQSQYNKGFIRFVKEWRDQTLYIAIVTADMICREVLCACKENGLDKQELWKTELHQHIQGIQKKGGLNIEKTVLHTLGKLALLGTHTSQFHLDSIGKEILAKSYERALHLPKNGLELESL